MNTSFSSYFNLSEKEAVSFLLDVLPWDEARGAAVHEQAVELVQAMRGRDQPAGQLEAFMRDYALDTDEGLALMTLAEALLRVPDAKTANMLIRDKVEAANWLQSAGQSQDWVVKAAGVGLFMTNKTLDSVLSRVGEPVIREAMVRAMGILGQQFVLGRDIEDAVQNSYRRQNRDYRMSYDILGEGARTASDAQAYFDEYARSLDYIGERAGNSQGAARPGISVKLSALHPRYEFAQKERCVPQMAGLLLGLARKAKGHDIALTVDAEEAARLNISIEIIEAVLGDESLQGWDGFGLAVQAYHKAAPVVIDHMVDVAKGLGRRIQMRLVKGAYWDTEIKDAQVRGLEAFPVYTRKHHSDVSYLACAHKMFEAQDTLYPMFGTHNAHSVAAILGMAEGRTFEFQRLFGMGQSLYDLLLEQGHHVSIYAPVGPHRDLLPYLVRRLLENGANSSFVNRALDPDASVEGLVRDPVDKVQKQHHFKHPDIKLPSALFEDEPPHGRANSSGVDLDAPEEVTALYAGMAASKAPAEAASIVDGEDVRGVAARDIVNPANIQERIGVVHEAGVDLVEQAFETAGAYFPIWSGTDSRLRAHALERAADLLEARRAEFIQILVSEAGKTIGDALDEVREAADFLRYYAQQGVDLFAIEGRTLLGPTGESNRLLLRGRGVFVCISPWNFPLAIFTGQIAAALMAGNVVLTKPAEQTPLVAYMMVRLLHEAGIDSGALHLLCGDGRVGAALVAHKDVGGVAFTGSTEVAQEINLTLAQKREGIVPFIAETGGQNAMIVDSSALPEQVVDDVIVSAFGSTGQRCSALRILCLQDEIADTVLNMLNGAMQEQVIGDPYALSSDIGPVIDEDARAVLVRHRENLKGFGHFIADIPMDDALKAQGHYFAPCVFELEDIKGLEREVFGPILHVVRYKKAALDELLQQISDTGYGLTLGVHSRIESFHAHVQAKLPVGNSYVNRSMTGAIVGSQPFGGKGLSGTGPKAGGPHYLPRFASERVISVDTTAAGGNASLVTLEE